MRVEAVALGKVERDGTVREQHAGTVDLGKIGLKAGRSEFLAGHAHGQQGRDVPFAGGYDPFAVQQGQCQAARVMQRGEQVEAAQRQSVEGVFGYKLL